MRLPETSRQLPGAAYPSLLLWLRDRSEGEFAPLVGFSIVSAYITCVFLSDLINLPCNCVAVSGT